MPKAQDYKDRYVGSLVRRESVEHVTLIPDWGQVGQRDGIVRACVLYPRKLCRVSDNRDNMRDIPCMCRHVSILG